MISGQKIKINATAIRTSITITSISNTLNALTIFFVHDVLDKNISFTITALKDHLGQIERVKN